jgi:hypothetical protein
MTIIVATQISLHMTIIMTIHTLLDKKKTEQAKCLIHGVKKKKKTDSSAHEHYNGYVVHNSHGHNNGSSP